MDEIEELGMPDVILKIAADTDRKLAWAFFILFARCEFALKKSKTYLNGDEKEASANWDVFGNTNNDKFIRLEDPGLAQAIDYIKHNPPRKPNKNSKGELDWTDPIQFDSKARLLTWLLLAIRQVRNNLFHGGKFPRLQVIDPSRDRDLIRSAIVILTRVLPLDDGVNLKFREGIDL